MVGLKEYKMADSMVVRLVVDWALTMVCLKENKMADSMVVRLVVH